MRNILITLAFLPALNGFSQKTEAKPAAPTVDASTISGLEFRLVGPALTSGRVADIAIHPSNPDTWYVAAASGGVWKTTNHGTTFQPIFDQYGSYSIACVQVAPTNPQTIWVGTGENNNQRSVSYGDGVYKSVDGGKSFVNMGLKTSEHIGNIIIHPTDENTIWVASYGPVWSKGGERGVYKSTDGGKTWERTLFVSDDTGISEIAIDPSNPNILYAAAHQRRRHEWTYIGGGPESNLYRSVDGGKTWTEITSGLPKGEMGRIGIAVSPADPNYVYAIVEARYDKGGFFQSTNKGLTWTKMSGFVTSGNYYQEIIADPKDKLKLFVMDTWLHHTTDGGKTVVATGEDAKHVDNHCIWIDPNNTNHWVVGCDGGLYETYNHAKEWRYYDNLPIIQFYKVATDNSYPFYYIYGGTQDNNSMGGPSQSINNAGVLNADWFITNGGDGFESAIDPVNPNIAYAQSQYGGLVRYDKSSGEKISIQPLPGKGEAAYRWNWDSPLLVSPHDPATLYFAANKVFKTSNRGDDWKVISPDLTQQIDRNKLPVMGQVWSMDAVMKNQSTTIHGNILALDESPKKKGLLYAGTDDGVIQVSDNDGQTWTKVQTFAGVPKNTRVNMILASRFNENEVFATFNNQRNGDFKPYVLKSSDKGKTWVSIAGNLPERGTVYCIQQDFINPNVLFAGTEFGAYTSIDGGKNWMKLAGLPTIAVYDLDIQKRESDLVAATFGRGFYVLDNYAALRELADKAVGKEAYLFPVDTALLYIPSAPLGLTGTGSQGHNLWNAPNPEFGATFTLYLKDVPKTLRDQRREKETKAEKEKQAVDYPEWSALRKEEQEEKAQLLWVIKDANGKEVRKILSQPSKGISRTTWNLRMESTSPVNPKKRKPGRYETADDGQLVIAGRYTVEVFMLKEGNLTSLSTPVSFEVKNLNNHALPAMNKEALLAFRQEVSEMHRKVSGSAKLMNETKEKLDMMKYAIQTYPSTDMKLLEEVRQLRLMYDSCSLLIYGDRLKASKEFETPPSFASRLDYINYQLFESSSGVTQTQRDNLKIVNEEYVAFRQVLDLLVKRTNAVAEKLDEMGIPYTQGKNEKWKEN
jgi:photosystem II stability/assembly factor-like uncharacterized protein